MLHLQAFNFYTLPVFDTNSMNIFVRRECYFEFDIVNFTNATGFHFVLKFMHLKS